MSRQHLTTHLTIAPTSPSSSATYVLLRRWEASPPTNHLPPGNHHHPTPFTLHPSPSTQHPTPNTQLVRCLVRCFANTPPSETPVYKGFSPILVRCWPYFLNKQHQNVNKESASKVCPYMCTALAIGCSVFSRRISASVTTVADVTHRFPFDARKTACSFLITKRRRRFFTPLRPCCSRIAFVIIQ